MVTKINAIMIIEVAGRPPEYLVDSMKAHVDKLNQIKGVSLVSSKFSEARLLEEEKDLYTCFAEVEVQTETFGKIIELIFDFMPSSIEIVNPSEIEFDCQGATMLMNDLSGRLHRYDDVAKIARMQIQQLTQKLQATQQPASRPVSSPIQPMQITMNNSQEPIKKNKEKDTTNKKKKKKK